MLRIRYTKHARHKFEVLRKHGFDVRPEQVERTVQEPDMVVNEGGGIWIAQRRVSVRHVLRVVYRKEGDEIVVITFYPGWRRRYEGGIQS